MKENINMNKFIIDCISDTHNQHQKLKLPGGHILIHSGDFSGRGTFTETLKFLTWFSEQQYLYLILVPGNHDGMFEKFPDLMSEICNKLNIIVLNDSSVTLYGLNFWGSPIQPEFCNWHFNRARGSEIRKHWDLIPINTDVLITHGPPYGILDKCPKLGLMESVGCEELAEVVLKSKIKLHIFGHIHESAGNARIKNTLYVNAASLDGSYRFIEPGYTRVEYIKNKTGKFKIVKP